MPPFSPQSTRRNFLAGTAAGASLSLLAGQARAQAAAEPPLADYGPEFLSPAEYAFVMAATARLIPSQGEGPGALEARVPVFIDRQLAGDFGTAADLYMEGPFNPDADPQLGRKAPCPRRRSISRPLQPLTSGAAQPRARALPIWIPPRKTQP